MNNGEDQGLAARFVRARTTQADPIRLGYQPFYIYNWGPGPHLSAMGRGGYGNIGAMPVKKSKLIPADPPGIDLLNPRILPAAQRGV